MDLEALSSIDEESVNVGGQSVLMTALVPADIEKCRRLILSKKLDEGMAMEYLTFLAMRKHHAEVTWFKFQKLNFKTVNKLMATMAVMNGFNDTFQTFTGIGGSDAGNSGGAGSLGDSEDELDFD